MLIFGGVLQIEHAQNLATQWMWVYNNDSSIGGIPPRKLLEAI